MDKELEQSVCGAARTHFAAEATAPIVSGCCGRPFTLALLHIHDEASLRLRSFAVGAATERSRKSSVEQHAVWLFADDTAGLPVLTELHALANKTAPTLATSLDKVLRSVATVARRGLDLAPAPSDAEVGK